MAYGCAWSQPAPEPPEPPEPEVATPVLAYSWGYLAAETLSRFPVAALDEPGPGPPAEAPSKSSAAPFFVHTITGEGETLIAIARWYTGDGRNWKAIAGANPHLKPTRLHLGDTVKIPAALLMTRKPLPRIKAPPKRRPAPSSEPGTETIDTELFGPIVTPPRPPPVTLETLD